MMRRAIAIVLALAGCAPAVVHPTPGPAADPLDAFVVQLQSDDPDERVAGMNGLRAAGMPAVAKLRMLQSHADPEVRARATGALDAILGNTPLPGTLEAGIEKLLHTSQWNWKKLLDEEILGEAMAVAPKATIAHLISRLDDATFVSGAPAESQTYTVCGNALTLLERLADRQFDTPRWGTHHHACETPEECQGGHWHAWWKTVRDRPANDLFEGISSTEAEAVKEYLRLKATTRAENVQTAAFNALGDRVIPYLILLTRHEGFLASRHDKSIVRRCDAANKALRIKTGMCFGEIMRYDALSYDPGDPMRDMAERLNR